MPASSALRTSPSASATSIARSPSSASSATKSPSPSPTPAKPLKSSSRSTTASSSSSIRRPIPRSPWAGCTSATRPAISNALVSVLRLRRPQSRAGAQGRRRQSHLRHQRSRGPRHRVYRSTCPVRGTPSTSASTWAPTASPPNCIGFDLPVNDGAAEKEFYADLGFEGEDGERQCAPHHSRRARSAHRTARRPPRRPARVPLLPFPTQKRPSKGWSMPACPPGAIAALSSSMTLKATSSSFSRLAAGRRKASFPGSTRAIISRGGLRLPGKVRNRELRSALCPLFTAFQWIVFDFRCM